MNLSGTKLFRGYDEALKFVKKGSVSAKVKEKTGKESSKDSPKESSKDSGKESEQEESPTESNTSPITNIETEKPDQEPEEEERPIHHLVFVIHGIGQKLGYRVDTVNFPGDCALVRQAIKESSKPLSTLKDSNIPHLGGVQLLPVMWRQTWEIGLKKEKEKEDGQLSLEDITLEGVPSIRMLVSDVLLDGTFILEFLNV